MPLLTWITAAIGIDSPRASVRFLHDAQEAFGVLTEMPGLGVVRDYDNPAVAGMRMQKAHLDSPKYSRSSCTSYTTIRLRSFEYSIARETFRPSFHLEIREDDTRLPYDIRL